MQFLVSVPWCSHTQTIDWCKDDTTRSPTYQELLDRICDDAKTSRTLSSAAHRNKIRRACYFVHHGVARETDAGVVDSTISTTSTHYLTLRLRIRGGMDRQNRVGSKFGGGGVSSAQQSERERKERLKQLALESIDLAKDPYLVRNHLGTYECKLCLTLHRDEANYLAHTQGKKHQQGLGRRAHLEKLKEQQEKQQQDTSLSSSLTTSQAPVRPKLRIGRPAYQVFKSRDADTNQRCLSFELHYPDLGEEWQPRHRFMSAFEQRIDRPPDRRYQYLLFAAGDYETVAFRVPNEPIDKDPDKFVTHWDAESKRFTLTLHFCEDEPTVPS